MREEEIVQRIVETVLPGLDEDLTTYLRSQQRMGERMSRLAAIQELEDLAFSPEKVAERERQARNYRLAHGLLTQVWRECFRRLRERAGH